MFLHALNSLHLLHVHFKASYPPKAAHGDHSQKAILSCRAFLEGDGNYLLSRSIPVPGRVLCACLHYWEVAAMGSRSALWRVC